MRKTYTTTIEESIQIAFKNACAKNEVKMNEVLEACMESFIQGEFHIEKEIKYKIKSTSTQNIGE